MKVNENIRYYLRQSAYGLVSVSAAFLIGSATISADEVGSVAVGNTQSYAGIPEGVDDRSEVSAAESQRDKLWQKLAYADLRDHIDRKVVEELKDQLKKVELDVSKISALEKAFEAAKLSYFKENKDFTTKAIESAEELTEQQKKSLLEKLSVINSFSELAAIVENAKAFEIANETLVESEHEEVAPQVDKHLEEGKPMAPEVEVPAKPEREEVVPQVDKHLEEGKPMAPEIEVPVKSEREEVAPTEMSKSEDENNSDGKVSVAKADSLKAVAPKAEKKVANMLPSTGDSNGVALNAAVLSIIAGSAMLTYGISRKKEN